MPCYDREHPSGSPVETPSWVTLMDGLLLPRCLSWANCKLCASGVRCHSPVGPRLEEFVGSHDWEQILHGGVGVVCFCFSIFTSLLHILFVDLESASENYTISIEQFRNTGNEVDMTGLIS